MKAYTRVFGLLFLVSILVVACGGDSADDLLAQIEDEGVVVVSTDANYEPQSFLDADGNFIGFDIDVATEIADRLGVEVEFVTPSWDVITAGNWSDQWDMSVGSMTITPARQEVLDFADPAYYYTPAQFGVAEGSDIESLDDIAGQTVCVGASTTYESWLNGDLEGLGLPDASIYATVPDGVNVIPLETDSNCIESIQAGREEFVVFLTSDTVIASAMDSGMSVRRAGSPVFSENLAASFDKNGTLDNTALVERVSEILAEMHDDGSLTELSMNWFGADITRDPTK
jgi:polar amino acid transport system substrate-binding protein